ncbi:MULTISPECIES: SHOCT domain-containing protein [unclassified Arthrobacter]|uniref:SHOCT domain-containing protein n=1 Tax=unclassified Arthrobacter TaxID=235627 RepID=UPI002DFAD4DD|nr:MULTISPECIES: SHOCT domain-containing protein [unclassified Arthrobacter]MEC5191221.1 putative membrane protein [Arthrobacter sp. MP_M4]MEC5202540.1 putative membrane protein [Arthrobacter sp. MP_M7]
MMGYYGNGIGWMWLWGVLLLVGIAALVLLTVRLIAGRGGPGQPGHYGTTQYGPPGNSPAGPGYQGGKSQARLILEERFARGEVTAEQYREGLKVLGEEP